MDVDGPAYILNIDGLDEVGENGACLSKRDWIGVRFDCCGVYQRIYKSRDGGRYSGRCPRCFRRVNVRVGPEGTSARMFVAK